MTWNYRIIHHDKDRHPHFAIHEVYYDKDGQVESWTANPIDVSGENKTELLRCLR